MTTSFESLGMGSLSVDEKLNVVGQLWDDLIAAIPPGDLLTLAQRDELRRRIEDAKANPHDWVAWEDVLAATMKRLGQ